MTLPIETTLGEMLEEEDCPNKPREDEDWNKKMKEDSFSYLKQLQQSLKDMHELARKAIKNNVSIQKRNYDKGVKVKVYSEGDVVRLYQEEQRAGKKKSLQRFWTGPWVIVRKYSDVVLGLQNKATSPIKIVHADTVKPYRGGKRVTWYKPPEEEEPIIEEELTPENIEQQIDAIQDGLTTPMREENSQEQIAPAAIEATQRDQPLSEERDQPLRDQVPPGNLWIKTTDPMDTVYKLPTPLKDNDSRPKTRAEKTPSNKVLPKPPERELQRSRHDRLVVEQSILEERGTDSNQGVYDDDTGIGSFPQDDIADNDVIGDVEPEEMPALGASHGAEPNPSSQTMESTSPPITPMTSARPRRQRKLPIRLLDFDLGRN